MKVLLLRALVNFAGFLFAVAMVGLLLGTVVLACDTPHWGWAMGTGTTFVLVCCFFAAALDDT